MLRLLLLQALCRGFAVAGWEMTSSSEYGGFYSGPRGGGRSKGKTEPLGGVSLPTLGGAKPGGPNTTGPGGFGRGLSSRGNSRGNSRGGVNSRGGLFDRDQLPRTPSRRMAAARARAQAGGGADPRVGNGMPGSRGRRQVSTRLTGPAVITEEEGGVAANLGAWLNVVVWCSLLAAYRASTGRSVIATAARGDATEVRPQARTTGGARPCT